MMRTGSSHNPRSGMSGVKDFCRHQWNRKRFSTFLQLFSTRKADVLAAPLGHLYRMCADKNEAMTGFCRQPWLTNCGCLAVLSLFSHRFFHIQEWTWRNHEWTWSIERIEWSPSPFPSKMLSPAQVSPCRFCRPKHRDEGKGRWELIAQRMRHCDAMVMRWYWNRYWYLRFNSSHF